MTTQVVTVKMLAKQRGWSAKKARRFLRKAGIYASNIDGIGKRHQFSKPEELAKARKALGIPAPTSKPLATQPVAAKTSAPQIVAPKPTADPVHA